MKDDEFTKLFAYMERKFSDIETALADKADKSDVTRVLDALDGIRGVVEDAEVERTAHSAQLTRHDETISDLGERVTALQQRAA